MIPLKAILIFIAVYISLTLTSIFINHLLQLHPQVTINIAVVVLSAMAVKRPGLFCIAFRAASDG